ncbi:MAG: glucose-6-phosphate isomerase [Sphaerochaetaceae bacterium]|nr:glucose-6-phosphate isomerase [Sphaerochaetaceae bacterium]MDD4397673.1 glucose-6-phosphate isomerase [Sphaerochaetaceae bacterium]
MKYNNLDKASSFEALKKIRPVDIRTALTKQRIDSFSIPAGGGMQYSYAAMPVSEETVDCFQKLADEQQLTDKYRSLLSGDVINLGEARQVLHQMLRGPVLQHKVIVDGQDKDAFYKEQLERIRVFSEKIRSGELRGSTGKKFDTVCQIGIGGSDLGPRALYIALKGYCEGKGIKLLDGQFISNVDPDDAAEVLSRINMETTLFIVVSKSGTTLETLTNRDLVITAMGKLEPCHHVVAVTSESSPLAHSEGVLDAFFIDDYIGGRYSATSAVGAVILSCTCGFDVFKQVLDGAHETDSMCLEPDVRKNAAMMDACIEIYLRNVLGLPCLAVLPYSQALLRFPAHLQQLAMESNGKHVNRFGDPIDYSTEPIVFGEPGTNGQHSFYQLLHQGTDIVPINFIGFSESQFGKDIVVDSSTSQRKLVANLVAQIVAFAQGKDDKNPNKQFAGNRYSSLLSAKKLTPQTLGALLAHYENKTMFEGFLWNINSFDQEGVQLGKVLAKKVLRGCEGDEALLAYLSKF